MTLRGRRNDDTLRPVAMPGGTEHPLPPAAGIPAAFRPARPGLGAFSKRRGTYGFAGDKKPRRLASCGVCASSAEFGGAASLELTCRSRYGTESAGYFAKMYPQKYPVFTGLECTPSNI